MRPFVNVFCFIPVSCVCGCFSLLLESRCQVHSELALIEEEEGRLDPALVHLQKALLLDEGGVHRERLCSAVHLLQLSGTLYQTPARTEDQAAMLIQQVHCSPIQTVAAPPHLALRLLFISIMKKETF